jgi:hypothetical protein
MDSAGTFAVRHNAIVNASHDPPQCKSCGADMHLTKSSGVATGDDETGSESYEKTWVCLNCNTNARTYGSSTFLTARSKGTTAQ